MSDAKPQKKKVLMTLIPGKDALEAVKTPEGAQALYEDICRALGITSKPSKRSTVSDNKSPAPMDSISPTTDPKEVR